MYVTFPEARASPATTALPSVALGTLAMVAGAIAAVALLGDVPSSLYVTQPAAVTTGRPIASLRGALPPLPGAEMQRGTTAVAAPGQSVPVAQLPSAEHTSVSGAGRPGVLAGAGLVVLAVLTALRHVVCSRPPVLPPLAMLATGTAPKTGHHTAEEDLVQEALSHFFEDPASIVVTPTSGGVNNVVQYLTTPSGQRYILRIYNNGNKSEKVVWEHDILRQVGQQPLSFAVPRPLPSKSGCTHVLLSSGTECCIFHVIPGALAKTTSPSEVGRATGELCTAMGNVCVNMKGPIAPYWDVFAAHHAIGGNKALFYNEVATNPAFNTCREAIDYLVSEIRLMEEKLEKFQKLGLPQQIVHGDLHYDNVMVVDDGVSGLLDFEFCAYDWRAMELAVALSKYVGEADPLPLISEFVEGYAKHGKLTPTEMDIIPDLINLRIFSNVIYFTSRAIAKEDGIDSLTSRAGSYAKRVRWVNDNRDAIIGAIKSRMPR